MRALAARRRQRALYFGIMATFERIEHALHTVQLTLDALTSRGDDEVAFRVARAQYTASIRSSWPANLSPLVRILQEIVSNGRTRLTPDEVRMLSTAVEELRGAIGS